MNNKMKRKIMEVVLSALLVMNVMAVAACGDKNNADTTPVPTQGVAVVTKAPTNTPAPTATSAPTSTPRPTATPSPKPTAPVAPTKAPTTAPTAAPTETPDTTPKTGDSNILGILAIAAAASTVAFFTVSKISRRG